jgi:hypothetical protein
LSSYGSGIKIQSWSRRSRNQYDSSFVGAGTNTVPALAFLALTAQQYLGLIARIFAMKGNLKLAHFTLKLEDF